MSENSILSLTPSDMLVDKGLRCLEMLIIDKKYQVLSENLDPLRFKVVQSFIGKGSMSLAFGFFKVD